MWPIGREVGIGEMPKVRKEEKLKTGWPGGKRWERLGVRTWFPTWVSKLRLKKGRSGNPLNPWGRGRAVGRTGSPTASSVGVTGPQEHPSKHCSRSMSVIKAELKLCHAGIISVAFNKCTAWVKLSENPGWRRWFRNFKAEKIEAILCGWNWVICQRCQRAVSSTGRDDWHPGEGWWGCQPPITRGHRLRSVNHITSLSWPGSRKPRSCQSV